MTIEIPALIGDKFQEATNQDISRRVGGIIADHADTLKPEARRLLEAAIETQQDPAKEKS